MSRTIQCHCKRIGADAPRPEWTRQARLERRLLNMSVALLRLHDNHLARIIREIPEDFGDYQRQLGETQERYRACLAVLNATQKRIAVGLDRYVRGDCRVVDAEARAIEALAGRLVNRSTTVAQEAPL